jgi:dihydrofolate reductase
MQITFLAVQSINGFITRNDEPGVGFASREDNAWFEEFLHGMDLILMGRQSYEVSRDWVRGDTIGPAPRWIFTRDADRYSDERIPGKLEFVGLDKQAFIESVEDQVLNKVALCGGPGISSWFFDHGLVDEMYITVEPVIFQRGTPLLAVTRDVDCELLSVRNLSNQTLLLHYRVLKQV